MPSGTTEQIAEGMVGLNQPENSIVCFCYRLTTAQLRAAYKQHGSLKGVEEATRAGTGCQGCKVLLHALFEEAPTDGYGLAALNSGLASCVKPGRNTQKGFIIANGELESSVYASNAIAPQLGNCDTTSSVTYSLVDSTGSPIFVRKAQIKTNETFHFDTRQEELPRPFYGMFLFALDRSNLGASRFNIYWSNGHSATATHENAATGRPRVFLPILVDSSFLSSGNTLWLACMNPHPRSIPLELCVYELESRKEFIWKSSLGPYASTWINASEQLFAAAVKANGGGRFALKISSTIEDLHSAATSYFFVHNKNSDTWTCNHL